ncbi:Glutathione S-transferase T2 [Glycine soja]
MINFQYPTLPFHPYPPINPCMDQGSSIGTSNKQCNEMEYNTPSDFTSKSQVPPFSIQVGSENMRLIKYVKKNLACYKQACQRMKSRGSETNIMRDAHSIYLQDVKQSFKLETVWLIVGKESKWLAQFERFSKRTKVFSYGDYSSSSNLDAPSSYEPTSPTMEHPVGAKATKRKAKEKDKDKEKSSDVVDLTTMGDIIKTKVKAIEDLACARQHHNKLKEKRDVDKGKRDRLSNPLRGYC